MTATLLLARLHEVTRALVTRYGLTALPCEDRLAHRIGTWNGRVVALETESWSGDQGLWRLRVATMSAPDDAVGSLTVLALPAPLSGAPTFGADVVAFGGRLATVIVDLVPSGRAVQGRTLELLRAAREQALAKGVAREWTDAGESPFSPEVLFGTPHANAEAAVDHAYRTYLDGFGSELLGVGPVRGSRSAANGREFLVRLRQAKKQNRVLAKLFGTEWTNEYFDRVFFAEAAGS